MTNAEQHMLNLIRKNLSNNTAKVTNIGRNLYRISAHTVWNGMPKQCLSHQFTATDYHEALRLAYVYAQKSECGKTARVHYREMIGR